MKEIKLTLGQVAFVDEADFVELSKYEWRAYWHRGTFYARRRAKVDGKWVHLHMHRVLLNPPRNMVVDHINHNGLDNRRSNLRIVTNRENLQNLRNKHRCTSVYAGVYWDKRRSKWCAHARQPCGKLKRLGSFDSEIDAASAYRAFVGSLEVSP